MSSKQQRVLNNIGQRYPVTICLSQALAFNNELKIGKGSSLCADYAALHEKKFKNHAPTAFKKHLEKSFLSISYNTTCLFCACIPKHGLRKWAGKLLRTGKGTCKNCWKSWCCYSHQLATFLWPRFLGCVWSPSWRHDFSDQGIHCRPSDRDR